MLLRRYRLVILVLASRQPIFAKFRETWERYCHLYPEVKTHFVYGAGGSEGALSSDLVYEDSPESYPVNIDKTLKAFKYIDSVYDYDFLLRTNLSTFWDIPRLLNNLNTLPTENCYAGDGPFNHYVSGTDTIVNNDMITRGVELIDSDREFYESLVHSHGGRMSEDDAMGHIFHLRLGAPLISLHDRKCFMEDFSFSMGPEALQIEVKKRVETAQSLNQDNFRIKNVPSEREGLDPLIMNMLYHYYYNSF